MKQCIICRELKDDFNDEHVIPDSIQGYYHINSVCRECNSYLGSNIDNKLTNHKFIEFRRYELGIKGKSGKIPNPFSGDHYLRDEPDQKVRLEVDSDNVFVPRYIQKVDKEKDGKVTFILDKRDRKLIDGMIERFQKRNGIDPQKMSFVERSEVVEQPVIKIELKVDAFQYKLGILKIAYEFTVDQLPEYFEDPQAYVISDILRTASLDKMDKKVAIFGDGLEKSFFNFLDNLIDFDNNNHYLVLLNLPERGLICVVNLFDTFFLGIQMSSSSKLMNDNILIGKNDILNRSFETYDMNKLVSLIYSESEYDFLYWFPNSASLEEFDLLQRREDFDLYRVNGNVPFYNRDGNVVFESIEYKLINLSKESELTSEESSFYYQLDEELYIKLLPINKLFRVLKVKVTSKRLSKI